MDLDGEHLFSQQHIRLNSAGLPHHEGQGRRLLTVSLQGLQLWLDQIRPCRPPLQRQAWGMRLWLPEGRSRKGLAAQQGACHAPEGRRCSSCRSATACKHVRETAAAQSSLQSVRPSHGNLHVFNSFSTLALPLAVQSNLVWCSQKRCLMGQEFQPCPACMKSQV